MNIEKQKEEALKLLIDWYTSDCGSVPCVECGLCGFSDFCVEAINIVTGEDDNE